jgi:hypothetical protein
MIDDSEKKINSLNNFEFKPAWENERRVSKTEKNRKRTRESKKHSTKLPHNQRLDDYKISPYLKQDIIDAIKSKLKKDGITRSINSISKEIENKNLYGVTIETLDKKRKFFKLRDGDGYSFNEDQIVNELLYHKNLLKIDIVERVKVSKELKNVLVCDKTNAVFPPTSHNLFHSAIDYHLIKNKIGGNKEIYIKSLTVSRESEHIDKLNTDGVTVCVFYLPNNKKFSSISAIIKEIKENRNQQFFLVSETAKIEVKEIFEKDVFKHIQSHLKSNSKKIRKAIELSILRVLKKSKFHINTINNQNYVSAYHPIVDSTKELNSQSKKIIGVIANYKKTSIKSLISDSEKLSISKINIMKEIKWLIQIGIIRLYESGQIELINFDKS